jgi:hypothetical protein
MIPGEFIQLVLDAATSPMPLGDSRGRSAMSRASRCRSRAMGRPRHSTPYSTSSEPRQ